ncbi:hypothetical protein EDB19DRAFT_1746671 [Suillus lakei]|nr:hypothetical protein EDB19DRAFT_1746671 [Suillus lakei]
MVWISAALFLPSVRQWTHAIPQRPMYSIPVTDTFSLLPFKKCFSSLIVPRICHSSAFDHRSDRLQAPNSLYHFDGQTIQRNHGISRYPS